MNLVEIQVFSLNEIVESKRDGNMEWKELHNEEFRVYIVTETFFLGPGSESRISSFRCKHATLQAKHHSQVKIALSFYLNPFIY